MMTQQGYDEWCMQNQIADKTRTIIDRIREAGPSRRVSSSGKNVTGRYPSEKMQCTIQFESRTTELCALIEKEGDSNTLEFYDQPEPIWPTYYHRNGRKLTHRWTADFFVITNDGAHFEEWKTEEDLLELSIKSPNRYCRGENGSWNSPPAEKYCLDQGLGFKVRSSAEISHILHRNLSFLAEFYRANCKKTPQQVTDSILSVVKLRLGITLADLLKSTEHMATQDQIYNLISKQIIYADLHTELLIEPEHLHLFVHKESAIAFSSIVTSPLLQSPAIRPLTVTAGSRLAWDGTQWMVVHADNDFFLLANDASETRKLSIELFQNLVKQGVISGILEQNRTTMSGLLKVSAMPPNVLAEANRRYAAIRHRLDDQYPSDPKVHSRTERTYWKAYKEAEELHGCGFLGLIPGHANKGDHSCRFEERVLFHIGAAIDKYLSDKQITKKTAYRQVDLACSKEGLRSPSYRAFCNILKASASVSEKTIARKGIKAARNFGTIDWGSLDPARHGDRPWEVGHIDHTELDIELLDSKTKCNLNRPWLTILVDGFSRRILAVVLSYDVPSYRSCMLIIRECVRRHSRLPQKLVVDHGKEFESIYFESLLAQLRITKISRPTGNPHFGSICERLFNTLNKTFIHNLKGNTQMTKNVREVTKSHNPRNLAIWTLPSLAQRIQEWAYEIYDNIIHSALKESPKNAFTRGLALSGERQHMYICYDQAFMISTMPSTPKGTALMQPGRGLKINGIYYWCSALSDPSLERTNITVRYDPFNAGIAYALIKRLWTKCTSEYFRVFQGKSENEIRWATEEMRKRAKESSKSISISARKLALFLESVETEESDRLNKHQMQERENRSVRESIASLPFEAQGGPLQLENNPQTPSSIEEDDNDIPLCGAYK